VVSAMKRSRSNGMFVVPGVTLHLLTEVHEKVSSTQIRAAASKGTGQLSRYVPRLVAEYIKKERLYVPGTRAAKRVLPDKVLSFQEARRQNL
jgi:nicotinic acid mononucleotide adenylyltransferase